MKPDYIKAYHRRGKSYASLNKLELAIRDFQFILEKEPHNKEALAEVKACRKKLDDKLDSVKSAPATEEAKPAPVQAAKSVNKFVRVAIQEESDEEEEELPAATQEPASEAKNTTTSMVIEEVSSTENTENSASWWKQSTDKLNVDDFSPKKPEPHIPEVSEAEIAQINAMAAKKKQEANDMEASVSKI